MAELKRQSMVAEEKVQDANTVVDTFQERIIERDNQFRELERV